MSETVLDRYDALLLDLDGTVYHGTEPIPGAKAAIDTAREAGLAIRFVTNNASTAPADVAARLRNLDVPAEPAEVSTSAQAAAALLAERLPDAAEVLVVGTDSLVGELEAVGLRPVREAGDSVAAVVQGHSPDTGWRDLAEACLSIRAGALWVACNIDPTLPTERGQLPGNGSMVAALRAATGAEPLVAGKPKAPLMKAAAESAEAKTPLVAGDRLDTDIAGGNAAGYDSLVVLTGVTTPRALLDADPAERPRYLAADLTVLSDPIDHAEITEGHGWTIERAGDTLVATTGEGERAPLGLLRALCAVGWRHGVSTVRAADRESADVLAELDLD